MDFNLIHSQLLLSTPLEKLTAISELNPVQKSILKLISKGDACKVFELESVLNVVGQHRAFLQDETKTFNEVVSQYASSLIFQDKELALLIAISLSLLFIQNNFTGPQTPISAFQIFYNNTPFSKDQIQLNSIGALSAFGQTAYEDAEDAFSLLMALHILEQLSKVSRSLFFADLNKDDDDVAFVVEPVTDSFTAVVHWWRARAIQLQCSLFAEFSGPHISLSTTLLDNASMINYIIDGLPQLLQKDLAITFHLEKSKLFLESNLEHLVLPELIKAQNLTDFQFVLTGARAKRTKFQQTAHSSLVVLAKSNYFNNSATMDSNNETPESFELNSDLLLEKPHYENIGEEDLDEQIYKKQRTDNQSIDNSKLLPTALRQEYIPKELTSIDPNNQPNLSDFDNIQLLLRLYTLRATSPSGYALAEEQLMSLVSRVLYQMNSSSINYTIFSRGLWERSILETTKARTIERGILQMQSLVEEIGLKIKSRFIPAVNELNNNDKNDHSIHSNSRLRYIFQLPFLPRWSLDIKLAEKYLSLGIVKSAIEIYERLHLDIELSLCYASIGEESTAREIISKRLEKFPNDARAISILGDLNSDPTLWEKAWEIGKYWKAKVSLGKYYYYPPKGMTKDTEKAINHIRDALSINPLHFDTWFFYGCLGIESGHFELSAEAFTRCVSIDETSAHSWSNLSTSLMKLGKLKESLSALKKAISTSDKKQNWRLWENYLIVSAKLNQWDDVLLACRNLVENKSNNEPTSIDIPIIEKLMELLISSTYNDDDEMSMSFFQRNCLEFLTVSLPNVINSSSRLWRIIAKVEIWRKKPWNALECYEKAFRAQLHNPDLETDETVWNETVEACSDLVSAYESLGDLPGKHGAGDVVCKDWKYKIKQTIKSVMSKGKTSWEDSEGWNKLQDLKENV